MLKFEEIGKRQYNILLSVGDEEPHIVTELNLMFSPITNKFFRLTEFVEDCSDKLGKEFDDWFCGLIKDYQDAKYDYRIIRDNIDTLKMYCDKYLEIININFEDYSGY